MNRLLLIVGGLLVGILAALFIVPVFVDWNRYRGTFEEEASRLLGRDVRVSGRVNLRLLPTPYIRFEKVRVADTQGNVGEPLFRADDFTVWLAVGPLFRGELEATEIELKSPVLTVVLDDKGGGNWADLTGRRDTARFAPTSVSLNAVRVTNGAIAAFGPGGERTRVERINGELSAAALEGPYKVTAAFAHRGSMRELRLSTAKPEADGSVRVKGSVRVPETGASYAVDGLLRDVLSKPRLEGELTAKLPLPRQAGQTGEQAFDVKSAIKADTGGAELADIALSFEQDGRPQLASGSARIAWLQRTEMELALTSKWIDLDRVGGADAQTAPLTVLARILKSLGGSLTADGRTLVKLELEQATLGGEVVSALNATAERGTEGVLALRSFNAAIPGAGRIEANGVLQPDSPDAAFDGNVTLRGASLSRFLAWAARGHDLPALSQDGAFAASGKVRLGTDAASVKGLALQLVGNTITGEASFVGGANRSITLVLDGSELDLSAFVPTNARPLAAIAAIAEQLAAARPVTTAGAATTAPSAASQRPTDVSARLRLGRLVVGRQLLADVVADVTYIDGNLVLQAVRVGSTDWHVELRGDIAGASRPAAKGRLTAHIVADTAESIEALLDFAEVPAQLRPAPQRAGALSPLRLASRIAIGEKGADIYDIQLDGRIGSGRVAGSVMLDRKGAGWHDTHADLALTLDHGDLADLLRQILPQSAQPAPRAAAATTGAGRSPSRAMLRASGTPKAGLQTFASLDGGALGAEMRGRIGVTDAAEPVASGDIRIAVQDLAGSIAAAGYRARPRLAGMPVSGTFVFTGTAAKWKLETTQTIFGAGRLAGRLDIEPAASGLRITGRLAASELSIPQTLGVLAEGGQTRTPQATGQRRLAWPDGAFDLSMLDGLDLRLVIDAGSLEVMPGLTIAPAALDVVAQPRRIEAKLADVPALGGKLAGRLALEKVQTGYRLSGEAAVAGARLEALPRAVAAGTSGTATMRLAFDGAGYSPQSVVAALKGKGEATLAQLRLKGLSPSAPGIAAETVLGIKGEIVDGEVGRQLEAALGIGELTVAGAALALEIADGALKVAPLRTESTAGRITGTTMIDIETMRADSEWRIEPKAQPASKFSALHQPLPALSLVYVGPLADLARLDRRLQHDAFERELTVRKLERDVETLERVRLEDEKAREDAEQKRQEAEKRRIEAERQRSAEIERQQAEAERVKAEAEKLRALDAGRRALTPPPPLVAEPPPGPTNENPPQPQLPGTPQQTDFPGPSTPAEVITRGAEAALGPDPTAKQTTPVRAPSAKGPRRDTFGEVGRNAP